MSLKNCIIVLWVYVMYVLGAWIFSSGYLLKRIVVHRNSTNILNVGNDILCQNYSSLHSIGERFQNYFENGESSIADSDLGLKSPLQTFDKAIIIIIDALRYDFTVYQHEDVKGDSHYLNKLPVFTEMSEAYPNQVLHMKLFADPPTTTLQRLKGITTGSLPTFIDISLNFASSEIKEDNVIQQLNRLNKNIVFLGDETWESLFPEQFYRSYSFPSFNVKDLDTVDNGILEHIFLEMEKTDWSFIIAHFVGVDHCGHRYGPSHPAMTAKLQQMNDVIRNISKHIQNDTIMVVMGDHGMTASGDHGGDSPDEVTTTLFLYSSKHFIQEVAKNTSAFQVDLVPMLSLLLGLPIPFSNLGMAIRHPFSLMTSNTCTFCFDKEIDPLLSKTLALAENAFQVHRYLKEYSKLTDELPSSVLTSAEIYLKNASTLWQHMNQDLELTKHNLQVLMTGYEDYLMFVRVSCEKVWATFNLEAMFIGTIVIVCAVFFNLMLTQDVSIDFHMLKSHLIVLGIWSVVYLLYFKKTYVFTFLLSGILFMCRKSLESCIYDHFVVLSKITAFPTVVIVLLFFSSMSNSYVLYEDAVLLFLTQSILMYQFFPALLQTIIRVTSQACDRIKRTKVSNRKVTLMNYMPIICFLCLLMCIRIGSFFNKCREEQFLCKSSSFLISLSNLSSTSSTFKAIRLVLSWISVVVPIFTIIMSTKWTMREKNYTAAMICLNYGIVFIGICICLHWWLSTVPPQILDNVLGGNQMITARCALAISIIIFCIMWVFPFLPEKPWESQTNHLFSGSICLFAMSILMPLYLISIDGLASSLMLTIVSLVMYLVLNSFSIYDLDSEMWLLVVTWGLMSDHWFYCTGHQPTFPAIQWQAAFVFQKEVSSYIFAGFCVALNTFSSHIIHGITLPLLLTWNRPSKDPTKYLFKLVLKYICFHGIKLLGAIVTCFILRRHLMVWKIFTPKLIYEIAGMFMTMISTMLSYCFTLRVTSCYHKQIKNNFGQLWSQENE